MKNRLSRKTREQFEQLMVAAYEEGYQAGKESTVDGRQEESTQFKTEKRVAEFGERILVTKPDCTFGNYSDDGTNPKYVMDKYREFINLIYKS